MKDAAYKSKNHIDNYLKEKKEHIDKQLGNGSYYRLMARFASWRELMHTCHQAGSFCLQHKDVSAPPGWKGKFRLGILPTDDILREIQRIITHNGLGGVFPTNINEEALEAPDEIVEVADSPALHRLYDEHSPRPKDALGIALGLWSDEVQLTKSTGRKVFRVHS